jgi:hypothetical protein
MLCILPNTRMSSALQLAYRPIPPLGGQNFRPQRILKPCDPVSFIGNTSFQHPRRDSGSLASDRVLGPLPTDGKSLVWPGTPRETHRRGLNPDPGTPVFCSVKQWTNGYTDLEGARHGKSRFRTRAFANVFTLPISISD